MSKDDQLPSGVREMLEEAHRVPMKQIWFDRVMNFLEFRTEEACTQEGRALSTRSEPVDEILTLYWHPYENRLFGFRFEGFTTIAQKMASTKSGSDRTLSDIVTFGCREMAPMPRTAEIVYRIIEGLVGKTTVPRNIWEQALTAA